MYLLRGLLGAVLTISSIPVSAQAIKTDSLKQLALSAPDDSVKISAHLQLAFQAIFNDSKTAWQHLEEAQRMLSGIRNPYLGVYSTYVKAVYFDVTGSADSARYYFEKGLETSRANRFKDFEVKLLNGLGLNNWNRGYFQTALNLFLQVNELNAQLDKSRQIPQSTPLNNIGLIYQELGLYEKALEYHEQALEIRLRDPALLAQAATSYNNIGICYYHLNKFNEAEEIYKKGLQLSQQHKFLRQYYDLAGNLANTLVALNRYQEAQRYNLEVLNHDPSIRLPDKFLMNIGAAAAGVYLLMKKPQQALPLLQQGLDLVKQKPELEFYASDLFRYASVYYYMTGDVLKGKFYTDRYKEILEQKFSKRNAESVAEMEVKYETAEKERKILDQQLLIEQNNLILAKQRNQNIILTAAVIIIVLLAVIGFIYIRSRQQAREQKLMVQEKQLRLEAVLQATEEERQRIARDLHDGIGQQLSSAVLQLESAAQYKSDGELKSKINALSENLRKTSTEVRTLSHQMMPRALTELGLVPAITDLLNRAFAGTSMECEFHHHEVTNRFDTGTELALFRIVQELINNIIKHAHASKVTVNLLRMKDKLRLTVEDNGVGFDPDAVRKGHGLMNIRTRVESVKGSVLFEQNENAGTLVTVTVPIH